MTTSRTINAGLPTGLLTLAVPRVTLGAAGTSILVSGLNLATDSEYYVRGVIKNATGGGVSCVLKFNGDAVTTNYYRQLDYADGGTGTYARQNNNSITGTLSANQVVTFCGRLYADLDGYPGLDFDLRQSNGDSVAIGDCSIIRTVAANVTSIEVVTGGNMTAGSYVEVYKVGSTTSVASPPGLPYTPPVAASFAWVNQGGASLDSTNNQLGILAPATAPQSWRMLEQAIPSAYPWTLTACISFCPSIVGNYAAIAIGVKDTGANKMIAFQPYKCDTSVYLSIGSFSNPTTGVANLLQSNLVVASPSWVRIVSDATNFVYQVSANGLQWVTVYTAARTGYLTAPSHAFFGIQASASYANNASLISWTLA